MTQANVGSDLNAAVAAVMPAVDDYLRSADQMDTEDEVGQMAVAMNAALGQLRETMSAMGDNAHGLASSSEELLAVSSQMRGSAEDSATQASLVSAAAEEVSRNVQMVAAGTEEMSASIRKIAKNAHEASDVAARAVHVARRSPVRQWPSWVNPPRRSAT